jgi:nucleotide-binding universal stress UspA family protein
MISKELEKLRALAYAGGLRNISLLTKSSTNVSYTITHEMYDQEKYDLIVCGNSNKTGLEKLLLGSVAKNITKDAKTDVFVVKT